MFRSKFIQNHTRTIVKVGKEKNIHVLWGREKKW